MQHAFEMPHQEVPTVHNHEEYEDEPVEVVMFEGFVSKSFRCLNGIPFRKTETLNGLPAYSMVFEEKEYHLCFYGYPEAAACPGGNHETFTDKI